MLQQKMKEILQKEDDLQEIVQCPGSTRPVRNKPRAFSKSILLPTRLVGKDSLSEDQKCTLEVAKIIREAPILSQRWLPVARLVHHKLHRTSCSRTASPTTTS